MPVCPKCHYEYVEGITVCPDCNVPLVDEKDIEQPETVEDDWVVVYTSGEDYEIEMIKNNLEGAGIPALMLSQKDRNFPSPGDLSVVKLLVKRDDIKSAVDYIESLKSNKGNQNSDG